MLKIIALVACCVAFLLLIAVMCFQYIKSFKSLESHHHPDTNGLVFSVQHRRKRYTEEECWTTKCEKCGRQFLIAKQLPSEKIPWYCNGCGSNLMWSFPYTRVQIEYDDGRVVQAKNLIHIPGWVGDMRWMVDSELNEDVETVNVIIKKKGD